MKIINLKDVEKKLVKMPGALGVDVQLPIGVEDGTPAYSMRVFTITPGGHTPWHEHPFEHINYVISGEGALITEDGPYWLKPGDCVFVPPNLKHNYESFAEPEGHDFVFVCLVPKEYECGCPDDINREIKDK